MFESPLDHARITVVQDRIKSLLSKLFCAQHYDIYVDGEPMGILDGYRNRSDFSVAPGPHSIYVRAYARDSVSVTRVYGYSETLAVELAPGEHQSFSCGLMPSPPLVIGVRGDRAAAGDRRRPDRLAAPAHALRPDDDRRPRNPRLRLDRLLVETRLRHLSATRNAAKPSQGRKPVGLNPGAPEPALSLPKGPALSRPG